VINLGSLNCFMAVPDIMPYVASKMGILGLTRSMCVEWSKYNINVNALAPGFVATELTRKLFENPEKKEWVMKRIPMGRLADPEKGSRMPRHFPRVQSLGLHQWADHLLRWGMDCCVVGAA
jgi:NAD(P)-dependent dehydrogenase (short-subunit alcohol dehydrogenase family)